MDGAWDTFWIKSQNGTFLGLHLAQKKFEFLAWVKKCHFGNFTRNRPIGWIGHALLVQPSISVHGKWPEMVVLASTNQLWTKITIRSYAWSFAIQIQIQSVWVHTDKSKVNISQNFVAFSEYTNFTQSYELTSWQFTKITLEHLF